MKRRLAVVLSLVLILLMTASAASALWLKPWRQYGTDPSQPPVADCWIWGAGSSAPKEGGSASVMMHWHDSTRSYTLISWKLFWGDGGVWSYSLNDGAWDAMAPNHPEDGPRRSVKHQYPVAGKYGAVILAEFIGPMGIPATRVLPMEIEVQNVAPTLAEALVSPDRVEVDPLKGITGRVVLEGIVDDPGIGQISARVDWGDGTVDNLSAESGKAVRWSHDYSTPGTYRPKVTLSDGIDSTVKELGPVAVVGKAGVTSPTQLSITVSKKKPKYQEAVTVAGVLRDDSTVGATLPGRRVYLQKYSSGSWENLTSAVTSTQGRVSFAVKQKERTTYRLVFTGEAGSLGAAYSGPKTVTPKVSLGTPKARSRMRAGRKYTVYGALRPRHRAGTKPVRIYIYRKVSGRWKRLGYVKARVYDRGSGSRYKVRLRLPRKGSYRLRAYAPADSRHSATWSGSYDYVRAY